MHYLKFWKYNSFWFPQVFDERVWLPIFVHNAFHIKVSQITPKLILHKIINVYPRIDFIIKGLSIFQKLHVQYDSS